MSLPDTIRKQPVDPEGVTDTHNIARRVAIEAERDVKVDLLGST